MSTSSRMSVMSTTSLVDPVDVVEQQIHTALFDNVHLLCTAFDNPKLVNGSRLQDHLRRDMFMKTNKFAFQEIVYFLLNIIDPVEIKKVPWPLFDKKSEAQFRVEVKKQLNNLNSKFKDARVPTVQTSHMLTPGGIKIARLLFYLSELAIIEHLQKSDGTDRNDNQCILLPFKVDPANVSTQLQHADLLIAHGYQAASKKYQELQEKIKEITNGANIYREQIDTLIEEVEKLQQELNENNEDMLTEENYSEFMADITKNLEELKAFETAIEQNKNVINATVANAKDAELTYESDSVNIPMGIVRKVQSSEKKLNLMEFLQLIDEVLQEFMTCVKQQPAFDIADIEELSIKIIEDYETFLDKFDSTVLPELKELNTTLRENIDRYNEQLLEKYTAEKHSETELQLTSEINFNNPTPELREKISPTSGRFSLCDTLTKLKKRNKKSSEKKSFKRNIIQSSEDTGPSNSAQQCQNSLSQTQVPNASSTPIPLTGKPTCTGGIRQLLSTISQSPRLDNSNSLNLSKEVLDLLEMDEELEF